MYKYASRDDCVDNDTQKCDMSSVEIGVGLLNGVCEQV